MRAQVNIEPGTELSMAFTLGVTACVSVGDLTIFRHGTPRFGNCRYMYFYIVREISHTKQYNPFVVVEICWYIQFNVSIVVY